MEKTFKKVIKIVKKASKIYKNQNFTERCDKHKFLNDDVTDKDIATQNYLKKNFQKLIPNSCFIGEEGSENTKSEYTWIVDPIDGTFNFKHNLFMLGTQICLLKRKKPIFSCLILPHFNRIFYADASGAYCNGKKIQVSKSVDVKDMAVLMGDFQVDKPNLQNQKQIFQSLCDKVKRMRMVGSSCMDSCLIACGSADIYIPYVTNAWDIIPGDFLMRQAGGTCFANKTLDFRIYGNKENILKILSHLKKIDDFKEIK